MIKDSAKKVKNFSLKMKFWGLFMPIMGLVFGVSVLVSGVFIRKATSKMNASVLEYSECAQAITSFREASDFLTNQVRFFVLTHNLDNLENFFIEENSACRREKAVEIVEKCVPDESVKKNLKAAYRESEELTLTEYYAMRLVCEGMHISITKLPLQVAKVILKPEDEKLSDSAKFDKASRLVYDYDYLDSKDRIIKYATLAQLGLTITYTDSQKKNNEGLKSLFSKQDVYIVLLFVVCFLFILFIIFFVLVPLDNDVLCIVKGTKMQIRGAEELKTIARAYNLLCEKNDLTTNVLRHKAEHDPLTGLINREAFENIKIAYKNVTEPLAFIMIDIDLFKQINDKYGHMAGDDVLRKVSEYLIEQFRSTDYIARVGGDEFAVLMTQLSDNPKEAITKKVEALNKALYEMEDVLPAVSLSVGIAFGNNGVTDELIKHADEALYNVKKNGRCNCSFYDDEVDNNGNK